METPDSRNHQTWSRGGEGPVQIGMSWEERPCPRQSRPMILNAWDRPLYETIVTARITDVRSRHTTRPLVNNHRAVAKLVIKYDNVITGTHQHPPPCEQRQPQQLTTSRHPAAAAHGRVETGRPCTARSEQGGQVWRPRPSASCSRCPLQSCVTLSTKTHHRERGNRPLCRTSGDQRDMTANMTKRL